jgi:LacI family transcriptional regulator
MARRPAPRKSKPAGASQARLRDVAARAGVHISTVSRVLNPGAKGKVSDEVAERIRQIAAEMSYRPNAFGYGLKTQRSTTIGIIVPDLANPVFPPMIRAIEHRLRDEGYTAILGDSDSDPEEEQRIIEKMLAYRAEGLILATAQLDDELVDKILEQGVSVVLINRRTERRGVFSVTSDDVRGSRLAVDHLADLGHRVIGHVGGPNSLSTGRDRRTGFLEGMKARDLPVSKELIKECRGYTETAGRAAMSAILDSDLAVTAIVAANDLLALGCYQALADRGLACPKDISITGYNDMPFTDKFNPPLTTVHIDLHQMGDRAAEVLIAIIRNPEMEHRSIELRATLVVRGSTAPPRLS